MNNKTIFNNSIENDKEEFKFTLEGYKISKVNNRQKINKLLNEYTLDNHSSMIRNVAYIRTILEDYEESFLEIYFSNGYTTEMIKYKEKVLSFFTYETENFKVEYTPGNNLKIYSKDEKNNHLIYYPNSEEFIKNINDTLKHIYTLSNIKKLNISKEIDMLIEIYRLFYDETPNFNNQFIQIRINTMLCILGEYGISLGEDYKFNFWKKDKIPTSIKITKLINDMSPLGKIMNTKSSSNLNKKTKETIKIIGKLVREHINKSYDPNIELMTISKVIFTRNHSLCSYKNIIEIADFTDTPYIEVENSLKLINCLNDKTKKKDTL